MDTFRKGYVYVRNIFAGIICETDEGYSFTYDKNYIKSEEASAVSLTLPITEETYNSKTLFPFFDGIIPEGWLLKVVSKNWKISTEDRFGLLLIACKDSIGNVSVRSDLL